jgi:hypothetical protein
MRLYIGIAIGLALGMGLMVILPQGPAPVVLAQGTPSGNGDVNGDGMLTVSDAVYLLHYLFQLGPAPVPLEGGRGLPATGQTECYDSDGNVIDCGSADYPGQDGFYQTGCPSAGRFVDNGDGTVTDTCTGLMWQQETAPGGVSYSWQEALQYCEGLELGGHTDWRLPNVRELQSIVDYGRYEPAIDPIFGAVSGWYWSSSTSVFFPGGAWVVVFGDGFVNVDYKGIDFYFVRAVRTGP